MRSDSIVFAVAGMCFGVILGYVIGWRIGVQEAGMRPVAAPAATAARFASSLR